MRMCMPIVVKSFSMIIGQKNLGLTWNSIQLGIISIILLIARQYRSSISILNIQILILNNINRQYTLNIQQISKLEETKIMRNYIWREREKRMSFKSRALNCVS